MWDAIYDSQRLRNLELEAKLNRYKSALDTTTAKLASTKAELKSICITVKVHDAKLVLHEISNGAAHPAIKLYQNGQLQYRTNYDFRDRVGQKIWRAQAAMLRDAAAGFGDNMRCSGITRFVMPRFVVIMR